MNRVAILCPCVVHADATTNDALGMYRGLSSLGHEVRLFANFWNVTGFPVAPIGEVLPYVADSDSVLIYHYSVGWEAGLEIFQQAKCKRIVKYHNVTPPEFFEDLCPRYTAICKYGKEQLPVLALMDCELYLSDSGFNQAELVAAGVAEARCEVVFPFNQINRLQYLQADLGVIDTYQDGTHNIVSVGRLAPNKGHLALVDSFAVYHYRHDRRSRLIIVGKEDELLRDYSAAVRQRITDLGLEDAVVLTGEVSDAALKAYYLMADVFLITSGHEGFCVPLVEAMSMKVPIVALGSTAVPETVGPAGLVWQEFDADLLADSVDRLVRDETLAGELGCLGKRRYQQLFANERIEQRFLHAVEGLL